MFEKFNHFAESTATNASRRPFLGRLGREAVLREVVDEERANLRVVVDDEDSIGRVHRPFRIRAGRVVPALSCNAA